jgi:chromosome segregation ATPase
MKYLSTAFALGFAGVLISLIFVKQSDNAQHVSDVNATTDFSNRLDAAQTQVAFFTGTTLTLSNSLAASRSATLTFSSQLREAQSNLALATEQITNLTGRVAEVESENQTLNRQVTELTNQLAGLARQIALTGASLDQANKEYALLENRLRRDVAERLVVDRKFNNPAELQAQLQYLKQHPAGEVSADSIYAGLDVEVKSNAFHVIAPN